MPRILRRPPPPPVVVDLALDAAIHEVIPLGPSPREMPAHLLLLAVNDKTRRLRVRVFAAETSNRVPLHREHRHTRVYTSRHIPVVGGLGHLELVEPRVRQLLEVPLVVETHLPARRARTHRCLSPNALPCLVEHVLDPGATELVRPTDLDHFLLCPVDRLVLPVRLQSVIYGCLLFRCPRVPSVSTPLCVIHVPQLGGPPACHLRGRELRALRILVSRACLLRCKRSTAHRALKLRLGLGVTDRALLLFVSLEVIFPYKKLITVRALEPFPARLLPLVLVAITFAYK